MGAAVPQQSLDFMRPDPEPGLLVTALLFEPFELWWAVQQDPALASRPLVSVRNERVVHANPAARAEGVTPGLALAGAKLKTSNLHVVDADIDQLKVQWSWQLEQLNSWSPWLHSPKTGRAWLLVSPAEARRLPLEYGVQVGAAGNLEVALAAALVTRPGELRTVEQGQERDFLGRVPINRLPALGFTPKATERFSWLGIRKLSDLFHWKESQLRSVSGPDASGLYRLLHGPWETRVPLYLKEQTFESSYTFEDTVQEPFEVEPAVRKLAGQLEQKLAGLATARVTVTTESLGLKLPDETICKEPIQDTDVLIRLIWRSLQRSGALALGVDTLSVTLADLSRPQAQQSLWPQKEARERAIRLVSRRYPGALLGFELIDPYSLARDRRFRLFRLDTGETVQPPSTSIPIPAQVIHATAQLEPAR